MLKKLLSYGVVCAIILLQGCVNSVQKMATVGEVPPISRIQNPVASPKYRPVTMPMPAPQRETKRMNSLWQTGARAFFKDQRANRVGDILTVLIKVDDMAELKNDTNRKRDVSEKTSINNFMGVETLFKDVLPEGVDPANLVGVTSTPAFKGSGSVKRNEKVNLKVAATVTQILPNGNYVISGRQEMRINYEIRELAVTGIVRPEDITSANTISYDKIAEIRMSYGGRGHITDMQQPPWGQQVLNHISPL